MLIDRTRVWREGRIKLVISESLEIIASNPVARPIALHPSISNALDNAASHKQAYPSRQAATVIMVARRHHLNEIAAKTSAMVAKSVGN